MENSVQERFAENLRALRDDAEVGQAVLAQRVTDLGVPMRLNTISRMENGNRVPDMLELLALALALGATPNRLLLTGTADPHQETPLTPTGTLHAPENAAWMWACGEAPLYQGDLPDDMPKVDELEFGERNRPHNPPNRTRVADFARYRDQLSEINTLIDRLRRGTGATPVPTPVLASYLSQAAFILEIDELDPDEEQDL